jgi:transcriptional regulator with XRE-family HTH domain
VIDYETFARIRDCRDRQGLTITQIARTLGLHRKTVAKWLARSRFERPRPIPHTRDRKEVSLASRRGAAPYSCWIAKACIAHELRSGLWVTRPPPPRRQTWQRAWSSAGAALMQAQLGVLHSANSPTDSSHSAIG